MRIAPVRIPTNQLRQRLLDFDYLLSQQHPSTISRELEKSYPYTLGSCCDAWSVWMPSDEQTPQACSWMLISSLASTDGKSMYSAIPHARLASLTSERPQAINGLWNAKLLNILTFAMLGSPQVWDMASIFEGTKQTHLPIDPWKKWNDYFRN